ncbi:MAG TPA: hypothetical protein VMK84_21175, partial [Streptosporangiaceae bacterium]|nr:hypothetical protein [Streptosporangiaceae bacterium]
MQSPVRCLGGLLVVGGGLVRGGVAGERAEFEQRAGGGRAVEVAVGDDGAVVGAAGAAVERVQVLDQLRAGVPEREGPGGGVAVGVAGVGEDVAGRDAVCWHPGQDGDQGAGRVVAAGARGHPPGRLGHGRAVLLAHHGGGGGVVAEEQLAVLAGAAAGAVSPGGLGVGAVAGAAGRRAGEGFHVGPVDGQRAGGVLELLRDGCLEQVVADALQPAGGQPVGDVLGERAGDQAEGPLGLAVSQLVRAVLPVREDAEPPLVV